LHTIFTQSVLVIFACAAFVDKPDPDTVNANMMQRFSFLFNFVTDM